MKEKNISFESSDMVLNSQADDPKLIVKFEASKKAEILAAIKKQYSTLRLTAETPSSLEFGITTDYKSYIQDRTIAQSIQVVRNRIDEFGITEPSISSKGNDRIVIELPGVSDIEHAKSLIGRTARLEFRMVNDDIPQSQILAMVTDIEKQSNLVFKDGDKLSEYALKINELIKGKIPEDSEVVFEKKTSEVSNKLLEKIPYLIRKKVDLTGDDLKDAFVQFDSQDNKPYVSLTFNPKGADLFGKVTGENIKKRLAIVLDGVVHSAPVIQTKIPNGHAQITMGGQNENVMKDAKDLSIVLRAGALPAQLELQEQRVIGPTLGFDSINKGRNASLVGVIAIFLFMMVYYRVAGVYANITLVLNGFCLFAILIGLESTLTLPGIAGLALTIGMAVDANILIHERIREELRSGKTIATSVESGFDRAFTAIFDSHITQAISGFVLLYYGTGPVRGFAVTLLIGVVTTLFTAVFVSKMFFDVNVVKSKSQKLSI